MILDAQVQFTGLVPASGIGNADGTDSPTTGSQVSSNIIDLHMAGIPVLVNNQGARDMGIGDQPALKLLVQATLAFAGGTSLIVTLAGATDNGSGAPNAFSAWYGSAAVLLANLVVGARLLDMDVPRPPVTIAVPRFLQLQYTSSGTFTGGAAGTASRLRGNIVLDRFDQMYNSTVNSVSGGYPPGVTILN